MHSGLSTPRKPDEQGSLPLSDCQNLILEYLGGFIFDILSRSNLTEIKACVEAALQFGAH